MAPIPNWVLLEIPDFILSFLYALLLLYLRTTSVGAFKTPFYSLFFTTGKIPQVIDANDVVIGVYGLSSVYTHLLVAKIKYAVEFEWAIRALWIVNHVGSLGSTFGKLAMVVHRYHVLCTFELVENAWSQTTVKYVMALQFVAPLLLAVPILFTSFDYEKIDGVMVVYNMSATGQIVQNIITITWYIVYVVLSITLSVITGRILNRLTQTIGETTRHVAMLQQRKMFLIVVGCSLGHTVKALHQLIWGASAYLRINELNEAVRPLYPYVNGLATYTAPAMLFLISPAVRSLFSCRTLGGVSSNSITPQMLTPTANDDTNGHMQHQQAASQAA